MFKLILYSLNSTVMPRKSKLAISRIQNLESNAKKKSPVTIEDEADSDSDSEGEESTEDDPITIIGYLDDFEEEPLPDLMSEIPDQDSDLDMDDEFEEIVEVSDLEMFANTLAEAQRVAVEAEVRRLKESNRSNRSKHYLGNTARTKRHHRQIGRELEAKGYQSIKTWFAKQKESSGSENASHNAEADADEVTVPLADALADDCEEPVESSPGTGLDGVVDEDEDPRDTPLVRVKKICG